MHYEGCDINKREEILQIYFIYSLTATIVLKKKFSYIGPGCNSMAEADKGACLKMRREIIINKVKFIINHNFSRKIAT